MRTRTKIWLIIATSLVLIGSILFTIVMSMLGWDFGKLSTVKYETNTYEINEDFSNISINTDTTDIIFALSDNGKCKVECYEEENAKHSVTLEEDTLVIKEIVDKSWYQYIGINFNSPKITVYLPKTEYSTLSIKVNTGDTQLPKDFNFESVDIKASTGDVKLLSSALELVKINTNTGKISIENASVGKLNLSVSTGDITVSDVICEDSLDIKVSTGKTKLCNIKCKNLKSNGNTGDIFLNNVIAAEKFSIERSTGDVKFDECDAAEIYVKTDTGDVTGTLLSEKIFIADSDTGSIDLPKTVTGGRCEISTDTGDIKINIE